ncbi:MAG: phosphoribosylamine--glycine ligase, partial [Ferruginibacter sp.]
MNILIIGSGGREHTLAWKIRQSSLCDQLFIAPGNAGTAACGTNIDIKTTEFEKLATFCLSNKIENGCCRAGRTSCKRIYDFFKNNFSTSHIHIIGPSQAAAQLEGSKAFAKAFMERHNIPTAAYKEFNASNYKEGVDYISVHALPVVLKADGLARRKRSDHFQQS